MKGEKWASAGPEQEGAGGGKIDDGSRNLTRDL